MSEDGGTAATIEGLVPPSNYIANKNEDSEKGGTLSTVESAVPPSNYNEIYI